MYELLHDELRKITEVSHEKEDREDLVLHTLDVG